MDLCGRGLDCGHKCSGRCKICYISEHHEDCHESCSKLLACGHPCKAECNSCQQCDGVCQSSCFQCVEIIQASCQKCGKVCTVKCSEKIKLECNAPCPGILECGHQCKRTCSSCPSAKGGQHPSCTQKCQRPLTCGHECTGVCSNCSECLYGCSTICKRKPCAEVVVKICARCNQEIEVQCSKQNSYICKGSFTAQLPCGHESTQPCDKWTKDAPCDSEVTLPCIICKEMKPAICSQRGTFACDRPCAAKQECGHPCSGTCRSCSNGHHLKCQEICKKSAACGHPCQAKCHKCENCKEACKPSCFKCEEVVDAACKRCGKVKTVYCFEKDVFQCDEPCIANSKCAHPCKFTCSKCPSAKGKAHPTCSQKCLKSLKCGHPCTQDCSKCSGCAEHCSEKCSSCEVLINASCLYCWASKPALCKEKDEFRCNSRCNEVLRCDHVCPGSCLICKDSHQKCGEVCEKLLSCGHQCSVKCIHCPWRNKKGSCQKCDKKCALLCSHGHKCKNKCGEPCNFSCNNRCSWGCEHNKCKHKCSTPCTHKLCEKSCQKNIECGKCKKLTKCMGVCGEDCPQLCKKCDSRYMEDHFKMTEEEYDPSRNYIWISLKDCGHSFPVKYIDEVVKNHFKTDSTNPLLCPLKGCATPVLNCGRYIEYTRKSKESEIPGKVDSQIKQPKQNLKSNEDSTSKEHTNEAKKKDMKERKTKVNKENSPKKPNLQNNPAQSSVDARTSQHYEGKCSKDAQLGNAADNLIPGSTAGCSVLGDTIKQEAGGQEQSARNELDYVVYRKDKSSETLQDQQSARITTVDEPIVNTMEEQRIQPLPPPPRIRSVVRYRDNGFEGRLKKIDQVLEEYIGKM